MPNDLINANKDLNNIALQCIAMIKQYDNFTAVDGLDLTVYRGECFGLLGPNGAGKTTTVEILEGLMPPTEGTVEVLGERWQYPYPHKLRARIGVLFQETQLADRMTVEEIIRLFRSFYDKGKDVESMINIFGLTRSRKHKVFNLSGGQRQRLALACTLVCEPELIFLDEPTTGLDPQARLRIWEIIEEFRLNGGTVLLTTHYMEEAARLCDRVAIIDKGKLIALGSPAELENSLNAEQIVEFCVDSVLPERNLKILPGVSNIKKKNGSYALSVSEIDKALPALISEITANGAIIKTLMTHQPTLEDVFVQLTGRSLRDR